MNSFRRDSSEVTAFGKEEPNNVVGVLVGSTLPGFMRLGKVDKGMQVLLQLAELRKLGTVIQAETAYRETTQQLLNHKTGLFGVPAVEQSHTEVTTSPVDQSNQKPLADAAIDGITLPITNPKPAANYIRPLGNDAIRLDAVIGRISGQHTLPAPSKVLFYGDRGEFSGLYVAVNGRNTEGFSVRILHFPASADFLRRPKPVQAVNDEFPGSCSGLQCSSHLLPAAPDVEVLGVPIVIEEMIIGLVVWSVFSPIAFDLAGDGRGTAT